MICYLICYHIVEASQLFLRDLKNFFYSFLTKGRGRLYGTLIFADLKADGTRISADLTDSFVVKFVGSGKIRSRWENEGL